MNRTQKLAKNTVLLSVCTLLNKGLMFVMVPLFTRWLSVDDYGAYDVLATYISLSIPIITLATSNAVFRLSVDSSEEQKREYITNGLYLVVFNLVLAIIIISAFAYVTKWNNFVPFIILMIAEIIDNYFVGVLRAIKKLDLYAVCKSLTVVLSAVSITIYIRVLGLGLNGLVFGYATGYYLGNILIILLTRYWTYIKSQRLSLVKIKELISYSWPLIPNDLSWWIINVSDRAIISFFIGTTANGIYAVANKIPNLCSSVFGVFNISWQENASEEINSKDREEYFNNTFNNVLRLMIGIGVGVLACNFIFFDYIFDYRYSTARLYTPILVLAVVFNVISTFFGGIQISMKNPKANGASTVIGAMVNITIHLIFVNVIGLYAAAFSTLISNAVVAFIRKILIGKYFKFRICKITYLLAAILVYYAIVSSIELNLYLNFTNLLFSVVVFAFANKHVIIKLISKLGHQRRV